MLILSAQGNNSMADPQIAAITVANRPITYSLPWVGCEPVTSAFAPSKTMRVKSTTSTNYYKFVNHPIIDAIQSRYWQRR
jgi:hypothetical protein